MIEILSLLGGAAVRLFPAVLDFFKGGRELKYELLRMDKEAELERLRGEMRHNEIAAMHDFAVDKSWADGLVEALKSQGRITKDKWLDRINVSVRPILTYWWCLVLYTTYKGILVGVAIRDNVDMLTLASTIVTDFDKSVIASMIGFWFVDRALRSEAVKRWAGR